MNEGLTHERILYLRYKKRQKILVALTRLLILIGIVALWEIMAEIKVIDSFIMSQPSRILNTFIKMMAAGLMKHIGVTCLETVIGFLLGTIIGTLVAVLLWWSDFISHVLEPILVILNSLPKIALGPVIIIWVGAGIQAIVVVAIAISVIVAILEMLNGFLNTEAEKIKMVRTFGANKLTVFTKVVFPSNIGTLFSSLKVNIGLSLVGVIAGEFLVSKAGLGYLIVYGGQVFQMDLVMCSVIILAVVAALMYQAVVLLEKRANRLLKFSTK
jgi:NitT/TauT family transport system permease protein